MRTPWRTGAAAAIPVVIAAGAIGAWFVLKEPGADLKFDTSVKAQAFVAKHPRVVFDHGHRNVHSISGRYEPFANLVRADGCRIESSSGTIDEGRLKGVDVLVIVNATGEVKREESAFSAAEIGQIEKWVRDGGSLLLVADHHPYGPAAAPLAKAFGVTMYGGWCDDEANARKGSGDTGQIVFTRETGLMEHPITRGKSASDRVSTVETFTGQSLSGPAEASVLLALSGTAMDRVPVGSKSETKGSSTTTTFETRDESAAGHCQGLAMEYGKGRVVVLGEAAMLTAQVDAKTGTKFGMNAAGNENRQFVLNLVRWLGRAAGNDGA